MTEDECRRYYENTARFRLPPTIPEAAYPDLWRRFEDTEAQTAAGRPRTGDLVSICAQTLDDFADPLRNSRSARPPSKAATRQLSGGDRWRTSRRRWRAWKPGDATRAGREPLRGYHVIRFARSLEGRDLPFKYRGRPHRLLLGEAVRRRGSSRNMSRVSARRRICAASTFRNPKTGDDTMLLGALIKTLEDEATAAGDADRAPGDLASGQGVHAAGEPHGEAPGAYVSGAVRAFRRRRCRRRAPGSAS